MAKRRSAQLIQVFLDSSVLFTAVNSPAGGSSKLFTFQKLQLITSPFVLTEVERNIREKLENYHLDRFFFLVEKISIINQIPNSDLIEKAKKATAAKDVMILSEVKQSGSQYLVTLDKKHFLTDKAQKFLSPAKITTPKILLNTLE